MQYFARQIFVILSTQYQHNISYTLNSMGLSERKKYTSFGKNILYLKLNKLNSILKNRSNI
jgi:hypothetical protein